MQETMAIFSEGGAEIFRKVGQRWYLWTRVSGTPDALSRACEAAVRVSELVGATGGWPVELAGDSLYPKPPIAAVSRSGTFSKDLLNGRFR